MTEKYENIYYPMVMSAEVAAAVHSIGHSLGCPLVKITLPKLGILFKIVSSQQITNFLKPFNQNMELIICSSSAVRTWKGKFCVIIFQIILQFPFIFGKMLNNSIKTWIVSLLL